jgi:hypothetical protein
MATQGLVSVVQNDEVKFKVVAGSGGMNASKLAKWLKNNQEATPQEIYDKALELNFGHKSDLVLQHSPTDVVANEDFGTIDDYPEWYRTKFHEPMFNPRWECGLCDHTHVVEFDPPAPSLKKRRPGA